MAAVTTTVRFAMGHSENFKHNSTSLTLLQTLRSHPDDASAWNRFVQRYQPLIVNWCLQRGLAENDADDVTQDVMLRMARFIRKFEHNKRQSFRAWLKTVTHHAWHDWATREQRSGGGHDNEAVLHSAEARDELVEQLERQHNEELMQLALLRTQLRVSESVWRAFELTALQGLGGIEAAEHLNIESAKVYADKSRVIRFLQEEVRRLESE